MFIDLILDSSVDSGMPSRAAAPEAPAAWPLVSVSAAPIISRYSIEDLLKEMWMDGWLWTHSR
jgi:hypothetical protein